MRKTSSKMDFHRLSVVYTLTLVAEGRQPKAADTVAGGRQVKAQVEVAPPKCLCVCL